MVQENGNSNGEDSNNGHHVSKPLSIKTKSIPIQTSSSVGSPSNCSSSLKRNISKGNLLSSETKEARVRVIYTGGTIGMVRNEQNGKSSKYI